MAKDNEKSEWAIGWISFAGTMMVIIGILHAITGLAAVFQSELLLVTENYIFQFDLTTWGWVHLLLGVVVFAAGLAVFSGAAWARATGVILATLSIIFNFAWMPSYPVWSITMVAVNLFVIWALTVHGRDIIPLPATPQRLDAVS